MDLLIVACNYYFTGTWSRTTSAKKRRSIYNKHCASCATQEWWQPELLNHLAAVRKADRREMPETISQAYTLNFPGIRNISFHPYG